MKKFKSDLEIASSVKLKNITEIASKINLKHDDLMPYGDYKAKIKISSIKNILAKKGSGKLILVSAMTPTPTGEGKTTISIGLAQALNKLNKNAVVTLREPSLGPCFGIKGGAAGGGYSQVLPMEDINLHLTGDMHAISAAHNLVASMLDNHINYRLKDYLSIRNIFWKRAIDMNDRTLRYSIIGIGKNNGFTRESGFEITAASEIMAILCLSQSYLELKEKIGNILLALKLEDKSPFFARDLRVEGAATALLKEAFLPNLVQTIEQCPAFIHGGPFANIAPGTNSLIAIKLALNLSDYVVTEAGFGSDLGAEKFFNIVSRYGDFSPSAVVLVASCRALKHHGGIGKKDLSKPNTDAILIGGENLEKHIENARKFGVEAVVAINRFPNDTEEELKAATEICKKAGAQYSIVDVWGKGGEGAVELGEKVINYIENRSKPFKPLYEWNSSVEEKIGVVAKEMYGARDIFLLPKAKNDLEIVYKHGFDKLPVCIAKTQNSLSDDPKLLGRPRDFILTVREIIISSGAGFLVPLTGEIMRMPGLPKTPSAVNIDINDRGEISGLF